MRFGDVNSEDASANTILAMLGVLDRLGKLHEGAGSSQASNPSKAQKAAVDTTNDKAVASSSNTGSQSTSKTTEKFVLLLELEGDSNVQQIFFEQLSELAAKIAVKTAYDAREAAALLASPNLQGVYVVDEGIQNIQNMGVLSLLAKYAHSGGLVVFGGMFGLNIDEESITIIFEAFGLNWYRGSVSKCEAQLNPPHETAARNPALSDAFRVKAVHLRGFHPEELFYIQYLEADDSDSGSTGDAWEAPVLRTHVGKGHVGYIGDITPEPESTNVLLSMLELFAPPTASGEEPYAKKFLLMLTSCEENILQQFIPDFMGDLRGRVEVVMGLSRTGLSNARVVDLLLSQDLIGVFMGGVDILYPENTYLLSKVVEYSKNGGTVVFGWYFCQMVSITEFRPLFREKWGLNWDITQSAECSVKRNFQNVLFKNKRSEDLKLPKKTRIEGIHIKGITKEMAIYFALTKKSLWNPDKDIYTAATVFTEVEKGRLGLIGSASVDGDCRDIIYTMFGLV